MNFVHKFLSYTQTPHSNHEIFPVSINNSRFKFSLWINRILYWFFLLLLRMCVVQSIDCIIRSDCGKYIYLTNDNYSLSPTQRQLVISIYIHFYCTITHENKTPNTDHDCNFVFRTDTIKNKNALIFSRHESYRIGIDFYQSNYHKLATEKKNS